MKQMYKIKPVLQTMLCYGGRGDGSSKWYAYRNKHEGKSKHKNEYINRNQNEYIFYSK